MSFPLTGQTTGIRSFFADIQYLYQRQPNIGEVAGVPLGGIARDMIDTIRRQMANAPTVIDKDYPQSDPVT